MSEVLKALFRARYAVLVSVVFLNAPQLTWSADGSSDELQRCRSIEDAPARLACYDKDNEEQVPEQLSQPAPAEPPPAKSLDDLGSETLGRDDAEKLEVRAVLTECTKNAQDRYYFHFENGQVWKQKSGKRPNIKDCEFGVTITKDFLGYKMKRDGKKGAIRISRVK